MEQFIKDDRPSIDNILLTGVSSFTNDPINLGIIAPSSEGKTYAALRVARLFPNATILTGATRTAFFYERYVLEGKDGQSLEPRLLELRRQKDQLKEEGESTLEVEIQINALLADAKRVVDLSGKLLIFLDAPDSQLWEALKTLLSHDTHESEYKTTQKSSAEEHRTLTITLRGWPSVIFCSARNEERWPVWEEMRTRFNIISPNMTEEKYKEANRLSAELLGKLGFALKGLFPKAREDAARQELQQIKETIDAIRASDWYEGKGSETDNLVFDPFASRLAELFPSDAGPRMRQFRYLLRYINAAALLDVSHRAVFVRDGKPIGVLACYPDLRKAAQLVVPNISPLSPHKAEFFDRYVRAAFEERRNEGHVGVYFTTRQFQEWAATHGKEIGMNSLKQTYLDAFVDCGLLAEERSLLDKRTVIYSLTHGVLKNWGDLANTANYGLDTIRQAWERLQAMLQENAGVKAIAPNGTEITTVEGFNAYTMLT